jgi:hypothetical protein
MDLGISKVVKNGNGNAIIYTALIAAAIANTLPTPFDAIYFRRVNSLQRKYDDKKISAQKLEWHIAGEYYLWTSLWYATLFTGVYALGGKYKTNAAILLAITAGGLVIGAVQENIKVNTKIEESKNSNKSFTGDEENFWNNAFEDTKSNLVVKGFSDEN